MWPLLARDLALVQGTADPDSSPRMKLEAAPELDTPPSNFGASEGMVFS